MASRDSIGQQGSAAVSSRIVVLFTALSLGFAALYWLLIALAQHAMLPFAFGPFDFSLDHSSVPGMCLALVLRVFGPALAAVMALGYLQGRPGLSELWQSVTRWRLPGRMYALAFFGPVVAISLVVAVAWPLGLLKLLPELIHPSRLLIFFPMMLVFDGPLGEEVGWRGVLLPQLLKQVDAIRASLLVGCVWFAWHIPLYLADGKDLHPLSFFVEVVSLSVITTWFFLKSGGSTAMAIFFHNATNYAQFLLIKSFRIEDADFATVEMIYDSLLVAVAIVAALALHRNRSARSL